MRRLIILILTLNIVLLSSYVLAEEEVLLTMDLDLEESISIALKKNPDILVARERLNIAETRVGEAKSAFPPRIDFYTQYTRREIFQDYEAELIDQDGKSQEFEAELRLPEDEFKTQFSLATPLYTGGRLRSQLSYASENKRVAQMDYLETEQRVVLAVKKAYYEVLRAKGMVNIYQEAKRKFKLHLKNVEAHHRLGLVKKAEVLSAQAHLAQMEQNLMKSQNIYKLAVATFNGVLGIDLETEVNLKEEYEMEPMPTGDLAMASAEAYSNRPDWKAMEAKVKMGGAEINLAKVQRHPLLDIKGDYTWSDENFPPSDGKWGIYVIGKFMLYDGNYTEERVKGKEAQLKLIKVIREKLKKQIAFEVKKALLNVTEVEKRLEVAKKNVDEVTENLRIIKEQFKRGLATSLNVMEMEIALMEVKHNYVQTRYDYHLARAQFLQAVGRKEY